MRDSLYFRYGGPSPWRADAAFAAHAVTTAIRRRSRSVDRERDIGADGAGGSSHGYLHLSPYGLQTAGQPAGPPPSSPPASRSLIKDIR